MPPGPLRESRKVRDPGYASLTFSSFSDQRESLWKPATSEKPRDPITPDFSFRGKKNIEHIKIKYMMGQYCVLHMEKRAEISSVLERHIIRMEVKYVDGVRVETVWFPDNADENLAHLNKELVPRTFIDPLTKKKKNLTIQQAVNRRIEEAGIKKIRKNQNTCIEIILSGSPDTLNSFSQDKVEEWAKDSVAWAQAKWGKENVVSATLHCDETTPHIHLILVPIVQGQSRRSAAKEKQNAAEGKKVKKYNTDKNKHRLCVNEVYTQPLLYQYHDSYAETVGEKYGLSRGIKAESGSKVRHQSSIEYNRQLAKEKEEKERLIRELTSDYYEKKEEFLQEMATFDDKLEKAKGFLAGQVEKIKKNTSVIQNQVADFNSRKENLEQIRTKIASNEEYLEDLRYVKEQIAEKKVELQSLSSLGLLKMIKDIPNLIIAEIQKRVEEYWRGTVTSYETLQYTVGGEKEDFAKIHMNFDGKPYFIEVREKNGAVYKNGCEEPYKWKNSGEVMYMPELAEFFRSEITDQAKELVESLYKKPINNVVWESKQILGDARIIKNAEGDFTLKTWDRDFKRWLKVTDCVNYSVKSDRTYDYITVVLANGKTLHFNQFGNQVSEKKLNLKK